MARWAQKLTPEQSDRLKGLARDLEEGKPRGWSVIFGDREILLRPQNRLLGKCAITYSTVDEVYIAIFSQPKKQWVEGRYSVLAGINIGEVFAWITSIFERPQGDDLA
jgi:hypothetical protein